MSDVQENRVWDTTITTGNGPLAILGVAPNRMRTIAASIADTATGTYLIEGRDGSAASTQWEIARNMAWNQAGNTLSRGTVVKNSAGTLVPLVFSAGTKDVMQIVDASQLVTAAGFTLTGAINWASAPTITAATAADIGAAAGNFIILNGATTVNGFANIAEGAQRWVKHTGGHVLTHHATNFILRGKASITTRDDDVSLFRSLGTSKWEQLQFDRGDSLPISLTEARSEIHSFVQAG